jgi:Fur family transcriptional regulator, ferric uptake regulator
VKHKAATWANIATKMQTAAMFWSVKWMKTGCTVNARKNLKINLISQGETMSTHLHRVQDEIRALLRGRGLRATASRMAVLVALHERQTPMTHDQIMTALADEHHDKASVWRILSELSEKGILRRMDLGDRVWRYELLDACRNIDHDHSHFLCNDCGDVMCLPPLRVEAPSGGLPPILKDASYQIRIEGTCGACVSG